MSLMAGALERVRVFVRKRPPAPREEQDVSSVTTDPANGEVVVNMAAADAVDRILAGGTGEEVNGGLHRFHFDGVFDSDASQEEVFDLVGLPVLKDVLRGFHGCVMAYGQTGSGKTHSLLTAGNPERAGLLPRLIATLFVRILADKGHKHSVRVSAVQVYNEQISDLLHPDHANGGGHGLNVQSNGSVHGTTWLPCRDPQEAMKVFAQARTNLVYAETKMNKASSRSHAVFQMEVARYATKDEGLHSERATLGVLTVVDLAGSERVKRSGVAGKEMKEAININGSLLALGNVVQALASQKKHVPYRDSKLTRILEPALSGNCRTSLLVCASPTLESAQETCHALEFASRAMHVEIHATVHEVAVQELCTELLQLVEEPIAANADKELKQKSKDISSLEAKLTQSANEAKMWEEKSLQEAKRANDVQDDLVKGIEEMERRHHDAVEKGQAALAMLRAEHQQQISALQEELQCSKAAIDAAVAAKEREVSVVAAAAKAAAEQQELAQQRTLSEQKEKHSQELRRVEARHVQEERRLKQKIKELTPSSVSAEAHSRLASEAASVTKLRQEVADHAEARAAAEEAAAQSALQRRSARELAGQLAAELAAQRAACDSAERRRSEAAAEAVAEHKVAESATAESAALSRQLASSEATWFEERGRLEQELKAGQVALEAVRVERAGEAEALLAAHGARAQELRARHAEGLAALAVGHEAACSELRWRLEETEEAYRSLHRRFEARESRPEDVAALALQRKTIRELSAESKQLGLELQYHLQTDRVFGGERRQARKVSSVGKKLSSPNSFNDRQKELIDQISQQSPPSLIEPLLY